jgi:PadR family transcriptional regulator PadR
MRYSPASALLDACVLGVISVKETYGYYLTQRIGAEIDISESTLYPVLRRLLNDGMLDTFDQPFDGRNRRYYKITEKGSKLLAESIADWNDYKVKIEKLLLGGRE